MPFSPVIYVRKTISLFFEYDTPRYVHINSKKIGIFSRLVQLVIISYIVGYVLVYNKGYQDTCFVESSVVTKVKGVAYTNFSDHELNVSNPAWYQRVWDQSDYVFPPSANENGGFFIMTNIIITPNQTRGKCPEDPNIDGAKCTSDNDCQHQFALEVGNGVQTGKCIPSNLPKIKTCEILAWCPVEQQVLPLNGKRPLLTAAENFTILIKNGIAFPKFGKEYQRRNILEDANSTYLQSCIYDPQHHQFCPVFRVGDIITQAGKSFHKIGIKGAVFRISIEWNCDLDWDFLTYCRPEYKFQRMDNPKVKIAPGFNFRLSKYYEENRRTLSKMFGIKFLIEVDGQARKFSLIPLLLNVGSGLALMGLVTIVCDLLVLYCLKSGKVYKEKKYLTVRGEDAFDVNPTQTVNGEHSGNRRHSSLSNLITNNDNDEQVS